MSKFFHLHFVNSINCQIAKLNSGNGLSSSNSNLFVFKNGWTTTNKDQVITGPGMFKNRPQSSHNYARRHHRNMLKGSDQRVWKYNQSNNELVPGIQSLNPNKTHSSFNVHHINNVTNASSASQRMAISGNGYLASAAVKQTSFKTSSNHKESNITKTSDQKVYS